MRQFAPVLLASLVIAYAHVAAARDPGRGWNPTEAAPLASSISDHSDADLLAERHLALYRASRASQLRDHRGMPENATRSGSNDDRDASPAMIRTSATAALPLVPRVPVHPASETSTSLR